MERATALRAGDDDALARCADQLADAGSYYQHARTLALAGDAHCERGQRILDQLGATPIATHGAGQQERTTSAS